MEQEHACYTYFSMQGQFDPDEITALLGLVPRCHALLQGDGLCTLD